MHNNVQRHVGLVQKFCVIAYVYIFFSCFYLLCSVIQCDYWTMLFYINLIMHRLIEITFILQNNWHYDISFISSSYIIKGFVLQTASFLSLDVSTKETHPKHSYFWVTLTTVLEWRTLRMRNTGIYSVPCVHTNVNLYTVSNVSALHNSSRRTIKCGSAI